MRDIKYANCFLRNWSSEFRVQKRSKGGILTDFDIFFSILYNWNSSIFGPILAISDYLSSKFKFDSFLVSSQCHFKNLLRTSKGNFDKLVNFLWHLATIQLLFCQFSTMLSFAEGLISMLNPFFKDLENQSRECHVKQ